MSTFAAELETYTETQPAIRILTHNFNDRKFRMDDAFAKEFYTAMTSMQGFSGYNDPLYGAQHCTGSLRDYFADNSYGKFDPEFDVVGPIHLDVSQYYVNKIDNAFPLMEKVLAAADSLVDFSKYDSDGDGDVDMFYVVFAGYSSSYQGNDSRLIWPFAATMVDQSGEDPDIIYDGVRLARFACSAEIFGWQEENHKTANALNVTTRACMRLVRANGTQGSWMSGVEDMPCDPFPGSENITTLDNYTNAAHLLSYDAYPCPVGLYNITEADGKITFEVKRDENAKARPMNFTVQRQMKASAEHLEGEAWVPVEWTVTSGTIAMNGGETHVLYNLLPNNIGIENSNADYSQGVYLTYTYGIDNKYITINAQRVALDSEQGIWFCNFSDAEAKGSGALVLNVDPYGLLSLPDASNTILGYRAQTTNAYMISSSKFIADLDSFRNLTFEEMEDTPSGIETVDETRKPASGTSGKKMINGFIYISKGGHIYQINGLVH